jgi:hypothetical protein
MTTPGPNPPLAADELVATGTEREVLAAFLDFLQRLAGTTEQHK